VRGLLVYENRLQKAGENMRRNKLTRHSANYTASRTVSRQEDKPIISEYERGTRWAGWLFVAMFCVLSLGSWWFGW
jgi:hypothetical protein